MRLKNIIKSKENETISKAIGITQKTSQLSAIFSVEVSITLIDYVIFGYVKSLSRVRLFATPWTVVYQAPQSTEFSRQEYWSGLPFPSPGDLPNRGIEPGSPCLQADTLPSEPPGKRVTQKRAAASSLRFQLNLIVSTQGRI